MSEIFQLNLSKDEFEFDLNVGKNECYDIYTPKSFSKTVKISNQKIQLDFFQHTVILTILTNPFLINEGFTLRLSKFVKLLSGLDGSSPLTNIKFDNYDALRPMAPALSHYRVHFIIRNWKNSTFNYRQNAEQHVMNMTACAIGKLPVLQKLTFEEHKEYLELDDLTAFEMEEVDKHFVLHFSLVVPLSEDNQTNYFGTKISFGNTICLAATDLNKEGQLVSKSCVLKVPDPIKHCLIENCYADTDLFDHYIYLKPNGIYKLNIFFDLIKFNIFKPERIIVCEPSDERIRYFYKTAHKRLYGPHWYNYLKENKMLLIHYKSDLSLEELKQIKSNFRKLSGVNWTLNVCHTATNDEEFIDFETFFNNNYI